jgi:hypothetical protein
MTHRLTPERDRQWRTPGQGLRSDDADTHPA